MSSECLVFQLIVILFRASAPRAEKRSEKEARGPHIENIFNPDFASFPSKVHSERRNSDIPMPSSGFMHHDNNNSCTPLYPVNIYELAALKGSSCGLLGSRGLTARGIL